MTPPTPPPTVPAAAEVSPARRAAEVGLALAALALAAPVLLAAAALVAATSPGGAVYTQTRVGRNGRPFRIYKLRSMVADSEVHAGGGHSSGERIGLRLDRQCENIASRNLGASRGQRVKGR